MDIKTVREFRRAVKVARSVAVVPRFGVTDRWVKISKADALALVKGLPGRMDGNDLEMYGGDFGRLEDGILYAG